jgi:hypothetical protein
MSFNQFFIDDKLGMNGIEVRIQTPLGVGRNASQQFVNIGP